MQLQLTECKEVHGKPSPNTPGAFIQVYINFDATVDNEIDGAVMLARHESMPRPVYIKGCMREEYGYIEDRPGPVD